MREKKYREKERRGIDKGKGMEKGKEGEERRGRGK